MAIVSAGLDLPAGTDITIPLQEEINRLEFAGHGTVTLPARTFKISDTIHLGHGEKFTHLSLVSEGQGMPYAANTGTSLIPTFKDRPMVNIQGGRGNTVANIQFIGPVNAIQNIVKPVQAWEPFAAVYSQEPQQQFCGISIDAFSGEEPTNGPHYAGVYGRRQTSMVNVERCQFRFLGAGIITKPSGGKGADAQGDYLTVAGCNFQFCQFGGSINGSQTRQNTFRECHFWDCLVGVGQAHHGTGLGGNILITGGSFDRLGYGLHAKRAAWSNRFTIRDVIGEQTVCIADVTGGQGVCHLLIDGTDLRFPIEKDYGFTPYHIRSEACILSLNNNIFRTYGESNRPTFMVRASTEVNTYANYVRRASVDPKNSPLMAIMPMHHSTVMKGDVKHTFIPGQTRIVGRANWLAPRILKGAKTLNCKVGEVYGAIKIGQGPCDIFRVKEVDNTDLTVEMLSCGLEVNDPAATMLRMQDWANFVYRIE